MDVFIEKHEIDENLPLYLKFVIFYIILNTNSDWFTKAIRFSSKRNQTIGVKRFKTIYIVLFVSEEYSSIIIIRE